MTLTSEENKEVNVIVLTLTIATKNKEKLHRFLHRGKPHRIFTPWQTKCNHNFSISLGAQLISWRTLHGKIMSAIYVNKSPNQLESYSGPASIYKNKTHLILLDKLPLNHLLKRVLSLYQTDRSEISGNT